MIKIIKLFVVLAILLPTELWAQSRLINSSDVLGAIGSLPSGSNGGITFGGGVTPTYNNCYWNDVNSCLTQNIRIRERLFVGNAVGMVDTLANCCVGTFLTGSAAGANYIPRDAQGLFMSDIGGIALAGISQTTGTPAAHSAIGLSGYMLNNVPSGTATGWAAYIEAQHNPATTSGSQTFGIEVDCKNASAENDTGNPYALSSGCFGLWIAGGGGASYGPPVTNPANAAIVVLNNASTWNDGILFSSTGLTTDANGNAKAILMPQGYGLQWYVNSVTPAGFITSQAAHQLQLEGLDQAAPNGFTIAGQNTLAGTTNVGGGNVTIAAGKGTGNQASGNIFFQTINGQGSGSAQNALGTFMTLNSGAQSLVVGGTTTVAAANNYTPFLEVKTSDAKGAGEAIFTFQNSATAPATAVLALSKSNTVGTQAAVTTNDQLGIIYGEGSDGTAFQKSSAVRLDVDAAVSSGIVPGRMILQTANAAGILTTALTINSNQHANWSGGTAPTLTAGCNGAGSIVSGNDIAGTVTGQTAAATTCTLSFGTAYNSTPNCVASGQSSPLTGAFTPSTASIVVNFASTANFKWSYICFGT